MSTDSKSSSGFWVKVIFWLVIIVLAFMYIRSLAKNPVTESAANTTGAQHEEMAASGDSSSAAGGASIDEQAATTSTTDESAVKSTEAGQNSGLVSGSSISSQKHTSPVSAAAPIATGSAGTSSDPQETSSAAAASSSVDQGQAVTSQQSESTTTPAASSQSQDVPQSIRDLHAESVSKILKEFDDLRDAAKAEMEAMRNLMQAERELQEAMASPPPVNPPAWRGRGPTYSPYGTYPQSQGYSPYNRR
ncbi:MAG: hypothetical protein KZQ90_10120 [Candidatus Thiodiazotropha sp. (ex Codakia rugifera)]|nr:hypothetical protein [Candidatus Thiodiazotropha sp. (ex Codakia rugifera)]